MDQLAILILLSIEIFNLIYSFIAIASEWFFSPISTLKSLNDKDKKNQLQTWKLTETILLTD